MIDELLPAARDIMTGQFVTLQPSVGLLDAVEQLERNPDHMALVVDGRSGSLASWTRRTASARSRRGRMTTRSLTQSATS